MKAVLQSSGNLNNGSNVGAFCWNGNNSSGNSNWNIAVHTYHDKNIFTYFCALLLSKTHNYSSLCTSRIFRNFRADKSTK